MRCQWWLPRGSGLFLLTISLLISACSGMAGFDLSLSKDPIEPILILAGADATQTPTPFQPLPVTPTFLPTYLPEATETPQIIVTSVPSPTPTLAETDAVPGDTSAWGDYPGPSVWPDVTIPPPTGLLPQPEDQVNILLLGSDQRLNSYGYRTDTIQLLTLNPNQGSVTLTSFPRDLYVYIPGWTMQRINTAFAHGGFDQLALTIEYNFGVRPDHYVLINLWSFEAVIDSLGGITVQVQTPLTDHRDGYGMFTIGSGAQKMDGETALWYVRSRYSTSDFDRGRRQQEVLEGIFRKLLSLDGISRAPQLYELYRKNVETDMSFDDMAIFLPLAARLTETGDLRRFNISGRDVSNFVNSSGAQVLLPNRDAIMRIMRQALNIP